MSMTNLTVETGSHAVERLYSRLTKAQKDLVDGLRADKEKHVIKTDRGFELHDKEGLVVILNDDTVEKLLKQEFIQYVQPGVSNIIRLNPVSWG